MRLRAIARHRRQQRRELVRRFQIKFTGDDAQEELAQHRLTHVQRVQHPAQARVG
jgi:hypothetical protein